jgi:hypothetical protein
VCDIAVRRDEFAVADSPFLAVAYIVDNSGHRLVVNERGLALRAFGRSPQKAAAYLASALRRRFGAHI